MQENKGACRDDPLPHVAREYHIEEADTQVCVSSGDLAENKLNEMPNV